MKKASKKASLKPTSPGVLLYSFQDGRLASCEVPQLRWEAHKAVFKGHRCGVYQGKAYLLEKDSSKYFDDIGHALREAGTLKVYNLRSKVIEEKIATGRSNAGTSAGLIVRVSELIDIGKYPRVVEIQSGQRRPIYQLEGVTEFMDFSACLLLNKTIFMAVGEEHRLTGNPLMAPECSSKEELLECEKLSGRHMDATVVYKINCADYSHSILKPRIVPPLNCVSLVPLNPGQFLILGHRKNETEYLAYTLTESAATLEGGSRANLGRCCSSAVINKTLFLSFESGVVGKCSLSTGLMKLYDFPRFERVKRVLWAWWKTSVNRLPVGLRMEILEMMKDNE